jgi:hypothetical protein
MRELNVRLILCFALLIATTSVAGCGGLTSSAGCSGQCGTSTVPGQTNTGGTSAELNGNYAFTFNGFRGNATVSSVFAAVGRFTADGAGNLTSGELVTNGVGAGASSPQSFTGTYSIGANNRGVMTLNFAGSSAKLAFAMTANGNAQFIEFDASGGAGTIGSGTMEKADTTAYSTARITGDYAFGAAGFDNVNNRAAIEGRFTSNGTGTLTNPVGDLNGYGTDYAMTFTAANYAVSNSATGQGTMHLAFTFGGTPGSLNFVFYVVNSGKLFIMESDAVTTATPLLNGVVVQQQTPAGGFSNFSLNSNMVISLTGTSNCGFGTGVPKAVAGLLTANGNGALSLTYDENYCRAPHSVTDAAGTYSVASNGRASIAIGGYSLVAYLVNSNQVFLFVSDLNVLFGFGEPQVAGSFNNSALKGTYAGFSTNPAAFGVVVFSGEFSADGATPTGNITGTEDIGAASGPVSGAAFQATYSVTSSPTNGRGIMTITSGTGGTAVIYMISATKFVAVSQNDPNPAILDFELSSVPASSSLSSLSLNPASVAGGNSSTGTVTLSGPAPTGGAQVALSSNNGAASVPPSVTIAAGATSATFAVSTSAIASSTTDTISAAYAGVTNTASLTVTAAPPPPPTLSSLSLNPTSVVGGNSSTGTVTLSGPAPTGGAQVALSSNNGAASVPSSVTVPGGATTATFPVNTTTVATSTPVTISATYSGATRTASLTVTPAPPPPPTLSSVSLNPTSVVGGNSSTGTVTLSGAASTGGAQVALSSNNGAASAPPSVTVPAGATTATFPVNTTTVASSTTVTISAVYSGVTRTASLAVAPAPPPPPTLSSLSLNPTSVIGGLQSSNGTATLSGPAPAGGVQVLLSSNNGAASVPSSVTVPAGATSATFTVSTSAVLVSTSVTISASYNSTAQTATLSVTL